MCYIDHTSFVEALKDFTQKMADSVPGYTVEDYKTIIIGCNYYIIPKQFIPIPTKTYHSTLRYMYCADGAISVEGNTVQILKSRMPYDEIESCFINRGIAVTTYKNYPSIDEE